MRPSISIRRCQSFRGEQRPANANVHRQQTPQLKQEGYLGRVLQQTIAGRLPQAGGSPAHGEPTDSQPSTCACTCLSILCGPYRPSHEGRAYQGQGSRHRPTDRGTRCLQSDWLQSDCSNWQPPVRDAVEAVLGRGAPSGATHSFTTAVRHPGPH